MNLTNFYDKIGYLRPTEYAPEIIVPSVSPSLQSLIKLAVMNLDEKEAYVETGSFFGKTLAVAGLFSREDSKIYGYGNTGARESLTKYNLADQVILPEEPPTRTDFFEIQEPVGVFFYNGQLRIGDCIHWIYPKLASQALLVVNFWEQMKAGASEAAGQYGLVFLADERFPDVGMFVKDIT